MFKCGLSPFYRLASIDSLATKIFIYYKKCVEIGQKQSHNLTWEWYYIGKGEPLSRESWKGSKGDINEEGAAWESIIINFSRFPYNTIY